MILDLGSFTRRGFRVDYATLQKPGVGGGGEWGEKPTEDKETTD